MKTLRDLSFFSDAEDLSIEYQESEDGSQGRILLFGDPLYRGVAKQTRELFNRQLLNYWHRNHMAVNQTDLL